LEIGTVKEGFKKKVPVLWAIPKEPFKSFEVELLLAERRSEGVPL
jgi:hypothetical protein